MDSKQAMKKAGFTIADAEIAFDHKNHDHMACAKCLGPRMRFVEAQRIYKEGK